MFFERGEVILPFSWPPRLKKDRVMPAAMSCAAACVVNCTLPKIMMVSILRAGTSSRISASLSTTILCPRFTSRAPCSVM